MKWLLIAAVILVVIIAMLALSAVIVRRDWDGD